MKQRLEIPPVVAARLTTYGAFIAATLLALYWVLHNASYGGRLIGAMGLNIAMFACGIGWWGVIRFRLAACFAASVFASLVLGGAFWLIASS